MVKWIEICLIGIGVIATSLIGYGQWNLGQQQNSFQESLAKQGAELQVIEFIRPHLESFASCNPDNTAQKMVAVASEYLSNNHHSTVVAEMIESLTQECPESAIDASTETRISEATKPSESGNRWFAVIATFRNTSVAQAKNAQEELSRHTNAAGINKPVEVYLTKISKSFAIVIGGPMNKTDAIALVRKAREEKIALDAFAQIDREWTKHTW